MIDLRPLATPSTVQVVSGEQPAQLAGRIDDSRDRLDDIAAGQAIARALRSDWLIHERKETFDYVSYWDTPAEIKTYIEEKRSNLALPQDVLTEAERLLGSSGRKVRLQIPFKMMIARYRKPLNLNMSY